MIGLSVFSGEVYSPALSEDAAFFTPAGSGSASQPQQQDQSYDQQNEAQQEGLAEYYQQALDLVNFSFLPFLFSPSPFSSLTHSPLSPMISKQNAPEYRQTPDSNPYANPYSHSLAPPGQNGLPGLGGSGQSAAAQAAAEAAYYNNGMHLGGPHAGMGFAPTRLPVRENNFSILLPITIHAIELRKPCMI